MPRNIVGADLKHLESPLPEYQFEGILRTHQNVYSEHERRRIKIVVVRSFSTEYIDEEK